MVIDATTFNGEFDLLEIRLNILDEYVDEFIIVEFPETFSGKPKPLYYEKEKERYKKWHHKIRYVVPTFYKEKYMVLANGSPNTEYGKGAEHWKTEFCQKEAIKDGLTHLNDDDIVFIGDVDEIWEPECIGVRGKLRLRVYTYYLNNRSSEDFYGTISYPYKYIKGECLNHLRTNSMKDDHYNGWHFTSMGGYEEVKRKLSDSYTRDSYWTDEVQANLEVNVAVSKDFLGRNFTYTIDESQWPQYLKNNREKYAHLLK